MKPLIEKRDFLGLDTQTWLYNGAECPPHKGTIEAVNDYLTARAMGPGGRERNARIEGGCKHSIARLADADSDHIALISNASEAICNVAYAIDWKPGDNVVIHNLEYPSGVLPLLALQNQGVEVRLTEHSGWHVTPETLLERVDERTRLVLSSHVSYVSGMRLDYKKVYEKLKATNALFLLDATQSLGVVPVDAAHADFVVCSSYKWLLGMHGAGILIINPARTASLMPRSIGWRSISDMFSSTRYEKFTQYPDARRFELGYPAYPTVYALNFSIKLLLDTGIENIERHVLTLGDRLIGKLNELGLSVMTPAEPSRRAGNIAFACAEGEKVADALREQNVLLWGGDGRVRASIHAYNDESDIDRYVEVLAGIPEVRA